MATDGAGAHDGAPLKLKPTMIIGLGGTGKEVLLRIRRLFYERNGRNPDGSVGYPIIGYLLLDTNNQELDRLQGETLSPFVAQDIALGLSNGIPQFIDCGVDPESFNAYFREGHEHPHVASWLLPEFNRFGSSAIVGGAGQNRPFGRLAFFHNYKGRPHRPGIRDTLTARIREVLDRAALPDLVQSWARQGVQVEPNQLDVILVYSLAGGTGAGMFLDMGMVARDVVKALASDQLKPHFTHIAVLPEAFINDTHIGGSGAPIQQEKLKEKIQANAFAALREMEYFAMRREPTFDLTIPPPVPLDGAPGPRQEPLYQARWSESERRPVPIESCPWDVCYLVGAGNEMMGAGFLPTAEIYQMIAEYLFLDFDPNQFGAEKRSLRSNQMDVENSSFDDPVKNPATGEVLYSRPLSRRFRIFGLSQIFFDRERMRRAAGYHLARRLIAEHWLRRNNLAPNQLLTLAGHDLIGGAEDDPNLVTRTGMPEDRQVRLGLAAVRDRMLVRSGEKSSTWFDMLNEDAEQARGQIERGASDYSHGNPIKEQLGKGGEPLEETLMSAGKSGSALRSFAGEKEKLDADIERRLRCLFLNRIDVHGITATRLLLKEYAVLAEKQAAEAESWANKTPTPDKDWRNRLAEARELPLRRYAQRATRAEALRAVGKTRGYLAGRYLHAAAPYMRDSLDRLRALVVDRTAEAGSPPSYARVLKRFEEALENDDGALAYLKSRFQAHAGETGVRESRTVGLFSDLSEEQYDRLILESPRIKALIQKKPVGGKDAMNWAGIEAEVLRELRGLRSGRWGDAFSLGRLVLQFCPLDTEDPPTTHQVDEFARELAEACEALLGGFATDATALQRFYAATDRHAAEKQSARLDLLRTYSAPYLRRASTLKAALTDAHLDVYLGIPAGDETNRTLFRNQTINPKGHNPQQTVLSGAKTLEMKDDALVLYQEKVGVPLCYYQGLETLGKHYDAYDRVKEAHFDYHALSDRLPEIRMVDSAHQRVLAETLKNTLYGIMTRRIRHDGANYLLIRNQGGPVTQAVGNRLERLVHYLADEDNEKARHQLDERITQWFHDASKDDGALLAALWCALQSLHNEINTRVQYMITAGRVPARVARLPHPIASILYDLMIPNVKGRLQHVPGGARFLDSALDLDRIAGDEEMGPVEKTERIRAWRAGVAPCFEKTFVEKVIPVLITEPKPGAVLAALNGPTTAQRTNHRMPPGDFESARAGHDDPEDDRE